MSQQTLHQDIVSYLAYIKQNNPEYQNDETLDVAIDSLCATFKITNPVVSQNLLNYAAGGSKGDKLKSLGNDAYASKNYDDAIFYFTRAIDNFTGAEAAKCYFNRGQVYKAKGDISEAENNFRKAVEMDTSYTKARAALSAALKQQGKPDDSGNDVEATGGIPNLSNFSPEQIEQMKNNPLFQGLIEDPEMQQLLTDPEVMAKLNDVMTNPMNAMSLMSDPKMMPFINKIMGKLGPNLGNIMGMFGGGK